MFSILTSHGACFLYGAAAAWGATHWTAVKTAEAYAKADILALLAELRGSAPAASQVKPV